MALAQRLNVTTRGPVDAGAVVFVHGFGCGQDRWRHVAPEFERDHRVVLFDLPGSGEANASTYDSIGLLDDAELHTVTHELGDETITLYTDGVTEARQRRLVYGERRLGDLIATLPHDPTEITEGIANAVLDYQGGDASDDIAIVTIQAAP